MECVAPADPGARAARQGEALQLGCDEAGDEDEGGGVSALLEGLQEFEAAHPGHLDVGDDHVGLEMLEEVEGFEAVGGLGDEEASGLQDEAGVLSGGGGVVHEEDVEGLACGEGVQLGGAGVVVCVAEQLGDVGDEDEVSVGEEGGAAEALESCEAGSEGLDEGLELLTDGVHAEGGAAPIGGEVDAPAGGARRRGDRDAEGGGEGAGGCVVVSDGGDALDEGDGEGEGLAGGLDEEDGDGGESDGDGEGEGGALPCDGADVEGALEALDLVAHDVEADASSGDGGDGGGGGEAGAEDESDEVAGVVGDGDALGAGAGGDGVEVDAASVVFDADGALACAERGGDAEGGDRGFSCASSEVGGFDAVADGVSDELEEGGAEGGVDVAVYGDGLSVEDEADLASVDAGDVGGGALEAAAGGGEGDEAEVLDLGVEGEGEAFVLAGEALGAVGEEVCGGLGVLEACGGGGGALDAGEGGGGLSEVLAQGAEVGVEAAQLLEGDGELDAARADGVEALQGDARGARGLVGGAG